jgi:hypothetical protein
MAPALPHSKFSFLLLCTQHMTVKLLYPVQLISISFQHIPPSSDPKPIKKQQQPRRNDFISALSTSSHLYFFNNLHSFSITLTSSLTISLFLQTQIINVQEYYYSSVKTIFSCCIISSSVLMCTQI